jgi:DNA-binding cell septation regulator SpoVG
MPTTLDINFLQKNHESSRRFRERRHQNFTDNYELYRDTVITNRLTQQQSVNVPLMKEIIRTILTKWGDAPDNQYEELGNDEQKNIFINEYWADCVTKLRVKILDHIDKKQVGLYGRSFMKLNIVDGKFFMEVLDPQDVLVDRYVNPWDIESARYVIHVGIYRTLSSVELNPMYDRAAITRLRQFFATKQGLVIAGENSLIVADRSQRMNDMGVPDVMNPIVGETYVELNEHQIKVWDEAKQEDVVHIVVTANGTEILMDKPLREILGVNFFTLCTWADDIERTDFWSDGIADVVRVPNQILNAYFSQMITNGLLRGYGMNFYDATAKEGWTPVGYDPSPFGFYPLPGKPADVLSHIEVPELPERLNEMNFIKTMVQSATASTAPVEGDGQEGQQTLGEIQMLLKQANERIEASSPFYKQYWTDIGEKFAAIVNANTELLDDVKLYKKSPSGKYWPKTLKGNDMKSKHGYKCKVSSKADNEADSLKTINKLQTAAQQFPGNQPFQMIYQKRLIDWVGLSPEEEKEVLDFQEHMPPQLPGAPPGGPPGSPQIPGRTPQPVAA